MYEHPKFQGEQHTVHDHRDKQYRLVPGRKVGRSVRCGDDGILLLRRRFHVKVLMRQIRQEVLRSQVPVNLIFPCENPLGTASRKQRPNKQSVLAGRLAGRRHLARYDVFGCKAMPPCLQPVTVAVFDQNTMCHGTTYWISASYAKDSNSSPSFVCGAAREQRQQILFIALQLESQ